MKFIKIININSSEITESSEQLNTNFPILPNVYTQIPRLRRQNSVHFNTERVISNTSAQHFSTKNQNIQLTPQQ